MYVKNKVALVTGGASGIGLCYVKELLKNGAKGVTIADLDAKIGEQVVEALSKEFGPNRTLFAVVDVVNRAQLEAAIKKTIDAFKHFDIIINNAGVMNDSIWEKEVDINIKGTVNGCLLAFEEYIPKYKSSEEGGVIVNISSILGLEPFGGFPVYTASKHAIIGLSKALADCAHDQEDVRIVTICPGTTRTPLLEDLLSKTPNSSEARYALCFDSYAKTRKATMQEPEFVAESVLKVIEEGRNGSMWLIEDEEVHELEIPDKEELIKS